MESIAAIFVLLTLLFVLQRRRRLAYLFFFVGLILVAVTLGLHSTDTLDLNF